uniref:Galanin and GMAP prepropeptide n=1 Tax=Cyanoderma ruficeps TaxID=181631 RepID=A0A8C3QJM5_9PASS
MQRCTSFLFLSLILCAALSETLGLVFSAKDKRGWTLNSAGYLLGPHAVDNHRSFNDKHGFTGKREIPPDEEIKAGISNVTLATPELIVFWPRRGSIKVSFSNEGYRTYQVSVFPMIKQGGLSSLKD